MLNKRKKRKKRKTFRTSLKINVYFSTVNVVYERKVTPKS